MVTTTTASADDKQGGDPVVIKKYANRRLYNTARSSYVTLDHLADMVREGQDFIVKDAKSGDDITRSVLTQIIFEEETKGASMLPTTFLRQIISLYGDSLQSVVPGYLEASMESFTRNQEQMREHVTRMFGQSNPALGNMETITRRNMELFSQAMSMFTPFAQEKDSAPKPSAPRPSSEIDTLKDQLSKMQHQLDQLARKS